MVTSGIKMQIFNSFAAFIGLSVVTLYTKCKFITSYPFGSRVNTLSPWYVLYSFALNNYIQVKIFKNKKHGCLCLQPSCIIEFQCSFISLQAKEHVITVLYWSSSDKNLFLNWKHFYLSFIHEGMITNIESSIFFIKWTTIMVCMCVYSRLSDLMNL